MIVFGHKNPDVDSVCSAIALSYFLNSTPAILGEINKETEFVLKYWKVKKPKLIKKIKNKEIFLVDHSEDKQSINNLFDNKLIGIIDHHQISLNTPYPIIYFSKPLGSTASVICDLYFNNSLNLISAKNKKLNKKIAGLLLSAIISDTMNFMSPTTTKLDKIYAKKLANIVNIKDIKKFGNEQILNKYQLKREDVVDIFLHNLKEYDFGDLKIGISDVNVFDKNEYTEEINKIKNYLDIYSKNYDLIIFALIYWKLKGSKFIVFGKKEIVEKAFKVKVKDNEVFVNGVLSRKLNIVPTLEKFLSAHAGI